MFALAGPLIGGAVSLFSSLFGAHQQTKAAETAVKLQTDALTKSTELQKQAADEALAFQRQQAEADFQNYEVARRGNYTMDAARQRRIGSIGEMVGLGPREIPDYAAGVDPNFTGGASTGGADVGAASQQFYASMQKHGLDPVAVQGHGAAIVAALKADYPDLAVGVDPNTDAVVWPGIGPLDVTIDSGKGGWSFRPSGGPQAPPAAMPRAYATQMPVAGSLGAMVLPSKRVRTPALTAPGTLGAYATGNV